MQLPSSPAIRLRRPDPIDAKRVLALVEACPPLDVNSLYCYLLLCTHFSETCTVAELDGELAGFQTGYRTPEDPSVLFIWQIGVAHEARGHGIALRMLRDLVNRAPLASLSAIHQTVGATNTASRALFSSLARELGAPLRERPLFGPAHFGDTGHESEYLIEIGPFRDGPSPDT